MLIASAVFSISAVFSEVVYIEDTGFVLEPPVGWQVLDVNESRWTFSDFTGEAFMQIKIYPGGEYDSAGELYDGVAGSIGAEGDGDEFELYGRDAVFSIINFSAGGFDYTGYAVFADGEDFDLAILSFVTAQHIELLGDYILSALDSFALSPVYMLKPGPVSTYYLQSYGRPQRVAASTVFEGQAVGWEVDEHAVEASQLMIEREASVLADYRPDNEAGVEAWKRYYRMIYRDSYSRLDYPASLLLERLSGDDDGDSDSWFSDGTDQRRPFGFRSAEPVEAPQRLLSWVQGFSYRRTEGSDLISPLAAAAYEEGDCDSRALLYIILLNHYGIDSALMVSSVYSHAMAAVDTEGTGARIDAGGKGYLVAETTDDVNIGMIASDMADPSNWIVIPLMEKEPWN